jgi:hypothetical protein
MQCFIDRALLITKNGGRIIEYPCAAAQTLHVLTNWRARLGQDR